jgi:hypothetical protein
MVNSRAAGVLGYGDGSVVFLLALLIIALFAYLTVSGKDRQPSAAGQPTLLEAHGLEPRLGEDTGS